MKLKTKKINKKIIVLIILVAALIISLAAYALYTTSQNQQQTNEDTNSFQDAEPLTPQEESQQQQKQEKTATQNDPQQADQQLHVHFTAANQYQDTVQIRAEISELITDGTCTLTLTKGAEQVTKTAKTQPTASISTCQGFDIPTAELSPGEWTIRLDVSKDNRKGSDQTTLVVS